ncbi:MAG: hypothetical protein HYR67_19845 [Bacteroidetes bacterium]|nr:hypothetical protein [Bacteroidota bacterium]
MTLLLVKKNTKDREGSTKNKKVSLEELKLIKIMKTVILFGAIILTSCSLGHKEVRYSEMASPPILRLKGDGILITTANSKENTAFKIYEIQPTIDEGSKIILLKGLESMGKELKTEFHVTLGNMKQDSVSAYKIYWVDPDNKRTELRIEN